MTLRKMYLVPAEDYDRGRGHSQTPPLPPPVIPRTDVKTKRVAKRRLTDYQYPHCKWVVLRKKLLEADINETELIHRFAEFLRRVLP